MAKEYIEREAAIKMIEEDLSEVVYYRKEDAIACLECLPNADVVKVKHGAWILLAQLPNNTICTQCPACGVEYTYKTGKLEHIGWSYARYNYCPNCGAKMDGEMKEQDDR